MPAWRGIANPRKILKFDQTSLHLRTLRWVIFNKNARFQVFVKWPVFDSSGSCSTTTSDQEVTPRRPFCTEQRHAKLELIIRHRWSTQIDCFWKSNRSFSKCKEWFIIRRLVSTSHELGIFEVVYFAFGEDINLIIEDPQAVVVSDSISKSKCKNDIRRGVYFEL